MPGLSGIAPDQGDLCNVYLMKLARTLVSQQAERTYTVEVPATVKKGVKQPKRTAQIRLAWTPIYIPVPSYLKNQLDPQGIEVWIVRAWEPDPPPGAEAVEWILLTTLPVEDWEGARYITQIYECRWVVEDYHMCLKTGCNMEASQLDEGDDLKRLLGLNALIAVRLLQLRQIVRTAPDILAITATTADTATTALVKDVTDATDTKVITNSNTSKSVANTTGLPTNSLIDPLMVCLLVTHFDLDIKTLTIAQFWTCVAKLGGHLGRKSESGPFRGHGPPGWRTIWKGWRHLSDWAESAPSRGHGVRLLGLSDSS